MEPDEAADSTPTESVRLTDEERRMRRRQKILAGGEQRLGRITGVLHGSAPVVAEIKAEAITPVAQSPSVPRTPLTQPASSDPKTVIADTPPSVPPFPFPTVKAPVGSTPIHQAQQAQPLAASPLEAEPYWRILIICSSAWFLFLFLSYHLLLLLPANIFSGDVTGNIKSWRKLSGYLGDQWRGILWDADDVSPMEGVAHCWWMAFAAGELVVQSWLYSNQSVGIKDKRMWIQSVFQDFLLYLFVFGMTGIIYTLAF